MQALTEFEMLRLNKFQRFGHKFLYFFASIPGAIWRGIKKIGLFFKQLALRFVGVLKNIGSIFVHGDWKTKVSFVILGFGNLTRGQILRGLLFLLFEIAFIIFMIFVGVPNMAQLHNLGEVALQEVTTISKITGKEVTTTIYVDNSFKILLYGVLSIFFILAFVYTWYINLKQNQIAEEILATGKKLKSGKKDLQSLIDDQFHKTLLSLPLLGILVFTVMPTFFMILIAFTNYSAPNNLPPINLFTWVGFENFNQLLVWNNGSTNFAATFGQVLVWTLIWAFFATFTNYFLGMLVALMINKKGIKFKKLWRSLLVVTIAIPQFISLLYVSKMFGTNGLVNGLLMSLGWIDTPIKFWTDVTLARITVIIVNIWVGIPYLMLMISGILMNIPADLYESARIDGANPIQQYFKITLPYTLFVTGPYLLTNFISNMNNFNVIYLLTGGGPDVTTLSDEAQGTDLLITWLYKITVTSANPKYSLASVIGIMIFFVISIISLIVYSVLPSVKNEEDYQ